MTTKEPVLTTCRICRNPRWPSAFVGQTKGLKHNQGVCRICRDFRREENRVKAEMHNVHRQLGSLYNEMERLNRQLQKYQHALDTLNAKHARLTLAPQTLPLKQAA